MRKVLVTSNSFGKYDQEPIKKLEAAGFEVVRNPYGRMMEEDEFIEQMQGAETVILSTEKVSKKVIDACPDLKMISRYGVGLDNIDLDYCKEKGIPVTVTRGGNSNAVAEFAVTLILAASKGILASGMKAKEGKWKKFNGLDLTEKTVGIVGLGAIGREVAKKLQGFDVKILAYDVYYDEEFVNKYHIKKTSLEDLIKNSDVITLHAPAIGDKPLLGEKEFSEMKDRVVIVNAARASLIDTDALLKALDSGKVFAAGLDVHEHEPEYDERFFKYDNVILTPHNAAITREATDKTSMMAVDHILEYFAKEK